jgi:UDP-N-acetylmuramoyl-tripeptide--D-alanyl-D-alanine ligase
MAALAAELGRALGKSAGSVLAAHIELDHAKTAAEAAECLAADAPQGGDAILVKGSNSVGLGTLVRALTAKTTTAGATGGARKAGEN